MPHSPSRLGSKGLLAVKPSDLSRTTLALPSCPALRLGSCGLYRKSPSALSKIVFSQQCHASADRESNVRELSQLPLVVLHDVCEYHRN